MLHGQNFFVALVIFVVNFRPLGNSVQEHPAMTKGRAKMR
jgi:hypothetical protein